MCDRWSNRYIFPTSVQTAGVGGYLSPGDSRIVRLFLFECHMHPVPQVTECPTNPNFSQMSVSAGCFDLREKILVKIHFGIKN